MQKLRVNEGIFGEEQREIEGFAHPHGDDMAQGNSKNARPMMESLPRQQSPMKSLDPISARFHQLKSALGKNIKTIDEVYILQGSNALIYRPIGNLDIEEVIAGRERVLCRSDVQLAGVEVALNEVGEVDPVAPRRRGCFRVVRWYTPDFVVTSLPEAISIRRLALDRESGWLRGGPR